MDFVFFIIVKQTIN